MTCFPEGISTLNLRILNVKLSLFSIVCGTETNLCRLLIRSGTNISWCHRVDDEHTVNESQEDRNQERNETDETLATEGTNRNNEDSEVLHELVR